MTLPPGIFEQNHAARSELAGIPIAGGHHAATLQDAKHLALRRGVRFRAGPTRRHRHPDRLGSGQKLRDMLWFCRWRKADRQQIEGYIGQMGNAVFISIKVDIGRVLHGG